jgi:hypothetical protein
MDPDACVQRILAAITDQDRHELVDAMMDLAGWLNEGGSLPHYNTAHAWVAAHEAQLRDGEPES